jgi:CheY-like chemotaxis protein
MTNQSNTAQTRFVELLLVEDSFGDAVLAAEAFAALNTPLHLSIAGDGEDALRRLRREGAYRNHPRPDLVLLDLNLPRMSGREVLQAIKTCPDLRSVPVVVMTGSDAAVDIDESYGLGANGYIVKPMHFERLEEIVAGIERFWFGVAALPSRTFVEKGQANVA